MLLPPHCCLGSLVPSWSQVTLGTEVMPMGKNKAQQLCAKLGNEGRSEAMMTDAQTLPSPVPKSPVRFRHRGL